MHSCSKQLCFKTPQNPPVAKSLFQAKETLHQYKNKFFAHREGKFSQKKQKTKARLPLQQGRDPRKQPSLLSFFRGLTIKTTTPCRQTNN